jgi:TRAP-type mannitol/chloroaromatic compound transport system permease small subunit
MAFLDRWIVLANQMARPATWFAGGLMLAAAVLVSIDVILRKLFVMSLGGSDELSGYAFAIGTAWAFAYTLLQRANVRVDALYVHLPSRARSMLDLLGLVSLGAFVGILTWQAWVVLETSLAFEARSTTPLQTPLWMPQLLWLLGLALFVFSWIPLFLRVLLALLAGDDDTVHRLGGARSLDEEAADETAHTAHIEKAL